MFRVWRTKMKKILLIFSLILGIFSPSVFAEEEKSVLIDTFPSNFVVSVGNTFNVNIAIGSEHPNTTFYYIFYGGLGDNANTIETKSKDYSTNINVTDFSLDCHNLPTITVDENGNGYFQTNHAFIASNNLSGQYSLYVSLLFSDCTYTDTLISLPRIISVLGINPTPTPSPTPTPTRTPNSTPTITNVQTSPVPTATLSPTSSVQSISTPTSIPTPTIDPKKFGILKSTPSPVPSSIYENIINSANLDLPTIQTGSNPILVKLDEVQKSTIPNKEYLGLKVFFIFLLVSASFTLYCLCFFGYTPETLLPKIRHLLLIIKSQFFKVLFILKKLSKIIYQYFLNLFKAIKTYLKNSQVIKKYFSLISQKLLIFLKICLKIFQKIIKYLSYFFSQIFIFIKEHVKIPRKIKRYLSHKKFSLPVFLFFSLLFLLCRSLTFATTDTITVSGNWVVPAGVNSIIIEAWGGGGAGGGLIANKVAGRGGGGAGGQYVKKTLSVSAGTTYPIIIGNGAVGGNGSGVGGSDTTFNTNTVVAKGGAGGESYDSGTRLAGVGTTAGGIGDTIYAGGSGSNGATGTTAGGAAGGGAGSTGAGGNASGNTAGVGTSLSGGSGGAGLTSSGKGNSGAVYGGGGGAGASTVTNSNTNRAGGSGAKGLMKITYTVNNSPSTPTLISPSDSSTGQSLTPTFKTVTTDSNSDNLQYELKICTDSGMTANCQTFDQTSSNIGWSGQDVGTSAYSSGTTATYILQIGNSLVENTTYYWKTRAKDYAGSNTWSSTQTTPYSFTTNSKPNIPTLVSPGTGTTAVSLTPELKTVTTDPNSDPLQYKIELCTNEAMSTGCNTYDLSSSITGWSGTDVGTSAYASGTTATYTVQVGSSLAASTTYYWRSYAKDPTGTSRWSSTQGTIYSFTTINQAPNKPTNTTPSVGATEVSTTPTLTASTFSDNDSGDTQNASQFQIATDTGFSSIVWETGTTGPASNSIAVSSALNIGTTYYWRVRYQDNHTDWSVYSDATMFVTEIPPQDPPSIPTLITPSDSATGQSLTPTFKTVTTDSNSDNLQYELKICTDSSMSTNCQTFDQTSSNIGWSGQDIGTSAYASGTTATYILQVGNSLAENTTYYWKTRAKDYAGSASWSSTQTTPYSFTTNSKPNTPTLVSPGTGTTAVSLTPELKTVTTDPNSDPLQYKIELCTNEAMSTGCNTYDLSSSITGWSGINVGTSAYSSGTTATYTVQVGSSLAASTTYYWRSYAKDPTGTTRWSTTQGTVFSFTTISPILTQVSFRWSDDDASGESRSEGVGDTWYDSNYDYRAPITVTNNVGTSLTDFQVRLTIGTSALVANGKMRSDCNDIRFTDNDKETPLSYYIESGCNSPTDAVVWVKIPTLVASTTRDIYLYYGYSSAVAASNGDDTFDAHDDFSGTSIDTNKWHDWNPQSWGTISISGGTLAINGTNSGGVEKSRGLISNSQFSFSNHIIEMSSRWVTVGAINTNGYYQKTTAFRIGESYPSTNVADNNYNFLYIRYNGIFNIETHYYEFNKTISGSNSQVASSNLTNDNPANFEITKYHYYSGPNQKAYRSTNGGQSFSELWSATNSNTLSNYYGPFISAKQSTDGSTTTLFDWFRIRKYADTEPTFSLGTETTEPPPAGSSGATWLAAENVGITGVAPNENIRLRFSIANTGVVDSANFRLQVAPKGASTSCTDVTSGNFTDVGTTIGSNLAVMTTSPNFTNQEATTNQLTDSGTTFVAGKMVEYDSNQSDSITLNTNEFTEVEYNFQMTNNVGATTPYCFRVVDVGTTLSTYTNVAQLTTIYIENNVAPNAPYLPYVNNTTAQSGQQTPVYGLIDHTPAFSAVFDDPNTANTASSYQLQVGSDTDWTSAEIWDSTKTAVSGTCNENSRCTDIIYSGGTTLVDGSTYYWRLKYWDNYDVGGSWSDTQQFSMNNIPSVSNVIINGNNSINLSENSSIGVSWVATVTDDDSYLNLSSATGKLYRSGVGQSCTPDNNNCYQDTSCDFINCIGNTCNALCSANIYFFTEATDTGSTFVNQYYQAWIEVTDNNTEVGSTYSSSTTVDVNTLSAFSIGQSLVYGEVFAGSDTGSSNTVVTVTNTGNSLINLEITGDYMCTDYPSCGSQSIEPYYQQYNTNTFTYGTGATLSTSPTIINVGISKPTQSPSNSYKNLYWGIGIPSAKIPGNYQGAVTILVD